MEIDELADKIAVLATRMAMYRDLAEARDTLEELAVEKYGHASRPLADQDMLVTALLIVYSQRVQVIAKEVEALRNLLNRLEQ